MLILSKSLIEALKKFTAHLVKKENVKYIVLLYRLHSGMPGCGSSCSYELGLFHNMS